MPTRYNESVDDEPLFENLEVFSGGMDSFTKARLLSDDASQFLQNALVEDNGALVTRFGTAKLGDVPILTGYTITALKWFKNPTYNSGNGGLIAALYKAAGPTVKVYIYAGSSWAEIATIPVTSPVVQMVQCGNKIYFITGVGQWYSWDGAATALVPCGTAVTDGGDPPNAATIAVEHTFRVFAAGSTAEPDALWCSDVGDCGQGNWDHVTYKIRVGQGDGEPIKAIVSGSGFNLFVFKTNSLYVVFADPSVTTAADWTIKRLSGGISAISKYGAVSVGSDVFSVDISGVRSVTRSLALENAFDVSQPISQPVQSIMDEVDWTYGSTVIAFRHKHLVLFGLPGVNATSPSEVLVFNARTGKWMGVWYGWNPLHFAQTSFSGKDRLVFSSTTGGVYEWLDYADTGLEATFQDQSVEVPTVANFKAWVFGDQSLLKEPYWLELVFDSTGCTVQIEVYLDGVFIKTWTEIISSGGVKLPVQPWNRGTVPVPDFGWYLSTRRPYPIRKAMRGLARFNEMEVHVTTQSKRLRLLSVRAAAFLGPLVME